MLSLPPPPPPAQTHTHTHRYNHDPLLKLKHAKGPLAAAAAAAAGSNGGSSNNIGCDFCNMAVQYIKLALHNNQTIEQIEEVGSYGPKMGWVVVAAIFPN
jgi:hypothetical protein